METTAQQTIPTLEQTLLERVLEEFKKQGEALQQVLTENQLIKQELSKTKVDLAALAEGSEKTFDKIGNILSNMQKERITDVNSPATPPQQQGGGLAGIVQGIVEALQKAASSPAANAIGTLSEMDHEILKTSKSIQMLSLKNTFKMVAKQAGVTLPEEIEHITVA